MSAAALLADLAAASVRLSLAGDNLHYQTELGVSIAPNRDRIAAKKPALVIELLQRAIVAAVDVEPDWFDRAEFDMLWDRWSTNQAEKESS